jgi:hypothetical protein
MSFLSRQLVEKSLPVKVLKKEAFDAGHTWITIKRAKKDLGVESIKVGGSFSEEKQQWVWQLPEKNSPERNNADSLKVIKIVEDAQQNNVSIFREFEHLQGNSNVVAVEI